MSDEGRVARSWSNWSGGLRFEPGEVSNPESEQELVRVVEAARERGREVRVVGAGHSSSPLVRTRDTLVSLTHFRGLERAERGAGEAVLLGGTTVGEAGAELHEAGLALHNMGDVDVQTLAGAICTGTHGTGERLPNLSSMLLGARVVTGDGRLVEVNVEDEPELLRAMRVSLGTFGVVTSLRVRVEPAFRLHRMEWCLPLGRLLGRLDELVAESRSFDFYWYPRSDLVKARVMRLEGEPMPSLPGRLTREDRGPAHRILPRERAIKFEEMEYHLDARRALACFFEVREKIKRRWRRDVAWRMLVRTVHEDDAMLSPARGRPTVTLSVHHNAGLPFEAFFADVEASFVAHGGRPHWGKRHTLQAADLRAHYPEWDAFHAHRRALDPDGTFMTRDLEELLRGEAVQ